MEIFLVRMYMLQVLCGLLAFVVIKWTYKAWIKLTSRESKVIDLEICRRFSSLEKTEADVKINLQTKDFVANFGTNLNDTETVEKMASKMEGVDLSFIPPINLHYALSKEERTNRQKKNENEPESTQKLAQKKPRLKQRLRTRSVQRRSSVDHCPTFITKDNIIPGRRNSTSVVSTGIKKDLKEPQANLKNKIHYEKLWKQIDQNSKQKRSQPKSNSKSLDIFNIICRSYEIQQACATCFDDNVYIEHTHDCKGNILLAREKKKGGKWYLIRKVPKEHKFESMICETIIAGGTCPQMNRCVCPHSDHERLIWNIFLKEKWGIEAMVSDLHNTDLHLRYVMEKINNQIKLLLVCKKCYHKQSYKTFLKARRKPHCMKDHEWKSENQIIVIELVVEACDEKKYEEINEKRDFSNVDLPENKEKFINMIKELMTRGVKLFDILQAHTEAKKRKFQKSKRLEESFHPVLSTYNVQCTDDCVDNFDKDLDDILSNEDVDMSEVEDSYKSDYLDTKSEHELYYNLRPHEDLTDLLEEYPENYKLCTIHLDGSQKATCTTMDNEEKEIQIRGRHNCGPTCNGDLVVVEIREEEVLDIEWKKREKEETKDDNLELEVTRGVVVGIMQQNINRKIYNFVCTVDEYYSHLMIPHCGTIPKIHVENDPIKRLSEVMKNRRVCVYRQEHTKFEHIRTVSVNPKNKQDKLFIVRYEKWGPTHIYPYGFVMKVLEPGSDMETGQKLLDLMYQVPPEYGDDINKIAKLKFTMGIPNELMSGRKDCSDLNVFSIDPSGCEDVDDALSVKDLKKTKDGDKVYEIGIHIADVTELVKKDDEVDLVAAIRKTSYYPASGGPNHMLPHIFSRNLCSLKANEKRLTLSLFLHMTEKGRVLGKPKFVETCIENRMQLEYTEAEKMIVIPKWMPNDEIANDIRLLHKLAKGLKKARLETGCAYRELEKIYGDHDTSPEAHMLIEEFMIQANTCAAEYLVEKLPDRAILRSQRAPNDDSLSEWQVTNKDVLNRSLFFKKFLSAQFLSDDIDDTNMTFKILASSYSSLARAAEKEDLTEIINIITTEKLHPSMSVAFSGWLNMQHRAKVHKYHKNGNSHFSLQKPLYTWFTSPIRRYMDVIVHRLIKSTLQRDYIQQSPYTPEEINDFSEGFNYATQRARKYSRACQLLSTACALKEKPIFVPAVVINYDNDGMEFEFPYLEHMPARKRTTNFSVFSVCDKPEERQNSVRIFWQKRIYDTQPALQYMRSKAMTHSDFISNLNHKSHTREVLLYNWKEVSDLILKGTSDNIPSAVSRLIDASDVYNCQDGLTDDVTSEMKGTLPIIKHHARFSMDVQKGSVLQVQLGASSPKGIIEPSISLLSLSKSLDICIEHTDDPVKCFADIATTSCTQRYRDVQQYQETWLPILAMEAASNSVHDSDPVIIHHVPVTLNDNNGKFFGHFEVHEKFVSQRHIRFISSSDKDEGDETDSFDYLCLRCPINPSNFMLPVNARASPIAQHFKWRNIWCAHARVTTASETEKKTIKVEFEVNQYNTTPPPEALVGKQKNYTVELLVRTYNDKRMEMAVLGLPAAEEIRKMVLGHTIPEDDVDCDLPDDLNIQVHKGVNFRGDRIRLPRNNESQDLAIRTALTKRFTLLQGPPGTGKTLTGVKLVYWFTEMNKKMKATAGHRQVMYCGPSNSAVDVATQQLRDRLGEKCPKIVRVYGSMLVKEVFPVPRDYYGIKYAKGRRYQMIHKEEQKEYALHHLIRRPSNKYSKDILAFDKLFKDAIKKKKPENVSEAQINKYEKLITDAAVCELQNYDVILCTCTVAGSPRIMRGTNIYQCIVDESGMCMEPQTLIPLVGKKPHQIVLIGDHRQLQPIVINQTAKDLGLEVSMFERQANNYKSIMLDRQYRMHEEICKFPSQHFYEGKLKTHPTKLTRKEPMSIWPNSISPIVFCHVEGEEKSLSVSTDEGNEQSKSNEAEVKHAIRIFMEFVSNYRVNYKAVTILSQYKSQCKAIEKELEERGFENPNVSTVVAAQGDEWDYVILSTVRSMPRYEIDKRPSLGWLKRNLGFIIDDHQINVAITRARMGLIIIGNKHVLQCDSDPENGFWGKLLRFYDNRGCIVNANLFPARPDESKRKEYVRNNALNIAEGEVRNLEFENRFREVAPRFKKLAMQQEKMFNNQQ